MLGGAGPLVPALVASSLTLSACQRPAPAGEPPVQVAAASDLTLAFEELGRLFEQRSGRQLTLSFAASGALARQLSQGAPFDVFAAANTAFVERAVEDGACDGSSITRYARGHVVAFSRSDGVPLASLSTLAEPSVQRVAIANPEHAPYGKAAREALERAGLWRAVQHKIVQAENVRQALQLAESGNADVALVSLALVAGDARGQRLALDPTLYAPIEQSLVVCQHGKNQRGGRDFARLVSSAEGQAILRRYGFASPSE